nr:MAG: replication associated protein [Cressdnaviricota sp.]
MSTINPMDNDDNNDMEGGNTKPLPSNGKKDDSSRKWCFTLNNYTESEETTIKTYISKFKYWIYGREIAPTTGTPHLQGFFESKSAVKFSTLKNLNNRLNLRKAKGDEKQNYIYCFKEGDFFTNIPIPIIKEKIAMVEELIITPNEWQSKLINELIPDRRTIHWLVDPKGHAGKNTMCNYLIDRYENVIFFTAGKATDIASQIILAENDPDICLFNFPRSCEGNVSYNAIETCKDGLVNTPKYKGGFRKFLNPHVIVFSNFYPDTSKLSKDRWKITELSKPDINESDDL